MHLQRLHLRKAPGLPNGILLDEVAPGVVLIIGPNGSGKSTLGRTIRGVLWENHAPAGVDALTRWQFPPFALPQDSTTPPSSAISTESPAPTTATGPVREATTIFGDTRWDGEPPQIPAGLNAAWHLSLREMIGADPTADHTIAREIQRQLDGGYDLSDIGPGVNVVSRPPAKLRGHREKAARGVRDLLNATDAIADRERELTGLRKKVSEAAAAPERLQLVQRAVEYRELLMEKQARMRELSTIEPYPEGFPDNAVALATDAIKNCETRRQAVQKREATLKASEVRIDQHSFPVAEPSEIQLRDWARRASELKELEHRYRELESHVHRSAEIVSELTTTVWVDTVPGRQLDLRTLETLKGLTQRVVDARAQVESYVLPSAPTGEPLSEKARDHLTDERSMLREWLSAPRPLMERPPDARGGSPGVGILVAGLILVTIGAGVELLFTVPSWVAIVVASLGALAIGTGLGARVARTASRSTSTPTSEVDAIERRYRERRHDGVTTWSRTVVETRIDAVDEALRNDVQIRQQLIDFNSTHKARTQAQSRLEGLEREFHEASSGLGFVDGFPELGILLQFDRIAKLQAARVDLVSATSTRDETKLNHETAHSALVRELQDLNVPGWPPLSDAAAIVDVVNTITERRRQLVSARGDRTNARTELDVARSELDDARTRHDELFARCGVPVGAKAQLHGRAEQFPRWRQLRQEIDALDGRLELARANVPEELLVEGVDLQTEQERLQARCLMHEDLQASVSKIEHEIAAAIDARDIQSALADEARAIDALAAHRDQQLMARVSASIVQWVQTQRESEDAPKLLERARSWFLRFTQNRYELVTEGSRAFGAIDLHSTRRQGLHELSDGTRVQLLLAARLAFIEHTENATCMIPLFVDEVLSTTDPLRFREITRAIFELAKAGRQIFYATADPGEAARWRDEAKRQRFEVPQTFNLGVPHEAEPWEDPPALPTTVTTVPPPGDMNGIAYTTALGLERPSLQTPAGSWPLSLLLHDDLRSVHIAVVDGVRYASQLAIYRVDGHAEMSATFLTCGQTRYRVLQHTLELLRLGRDKPVTWEDLERSKLITETFESKVKAALATHGHDPRALLDAIAQIPRFRKATVADLQDHLRELGLLDDSPTLRLDQVVQGVQERCLDEPSTRALAPIEVETLVRFFHDVVLGESSTLASPQTNP